MRFLFGIVLFLKLLSFVYTQQAGQVWQNPLNSSIILNRRKIDPFIKFRLFFIFNCSLLVQSFFNQWILRIMISLVFQLRWELHWLLVVLPTQIMVMALFMCLMVGENQWIDFKISMHWEVFDCDIEFRNYSNASIQFIWSKSTKSLTVNSFHSVIRMYVLFTTKSFDSKVRMVSCNVGWWFDCCWCNILFTKYRSCSRLSK